MRSEVNAVTRGFILRILFPSLPINYSLLLTPFEYSCYIC